MYFAFVFGDSLVVKKTLLFPDLTIGMYDIIGVL
jgi:hypothetical protein